VVSSRVFHDNYLVSLDPTVSFSVSGGAVANANAAISGVQPIKQGYATGMPSGTYTAIVDHLYRVEIHEAGSGAFGSAQWRWTDNAAVPYTDIVWNASNLTTQNGVNVALNNGVLWRFDAVGAFTPQFQFNDYWLFQVSLKHGYLKGLDDTRDHEYRSGTMPASATIEQRYDFGAAVQPTAAAIMDFNGPSNVTLAWKAKSSGFTDPPDATISMPWNSSGKIATLISSSAYRYWRLCVTTTGTAPTLGYLRWSQVFLGASLTFTKQFSAGFRRSRQRLGAVNVETLRRGPGPYMPSGEILTVLYAKLHSADQTRMRTLWDWTNDLTNALQRPFYVVLRDDVLTDFSLYQWTNDMNFEHTILDYYSVDPEWTEVVRSVA
jgi:hypothetical protein